MSADRLCKFVILGGLAGFEIAAAMAEVLGMSSGPISVAVRAMVAIGAVLVIVSKVHRLLVPERVAALFFIIFWIMYFCRIAVAGYGGEERLLFSPGYYWVWAVGACALPMLAAALWLPERDGWSEFRSIFTVLIIAGVIAAFSGSSIEVNDSNQEIDTGRFQLTSLNPILLGQLGTSLFVLGTWRALFGKEFSTFLWKLAALTCVVVGGFLLIASNSRGPLVSMILCLTFMTICAPGVRERRLLWLAAAVAVIGFIPIARYLEDSFGYTTYTRIFGQSQLREENTLDRLDRFGSALSDFNESPIAGSGLEERLHGGYPHNIFVEAFMAAGFPGGALLLFLTSYVAVVAVRNFRRHPDFGWTSLLFIQHAAAACFSGAIYTVNYFWISLGLVIAVSVSRNSGEKRATDNMAGAVIADGQQGDARGVSLLRPEMGES